MAVDRRWLEQVLFRVSETRRYTQDSPVMPDVWFGFGESTRPRDLLIEPRRGTTPAALARRLRELATADSPPRRGVLTGVACDESHVVAAADLPALVRVVLPLTGWWDTHAGRLGDLSAEEIERALSDDPDERDSVPGVRGHGRALLRVLGVLVAGQDVDLHELPDPAEFSGRLARLLAGLRAPDPTGDAGGRMVWAVHCNREASIAVWTSGRTVKADAATRLFALSCDDLAWAVLDTGIDATHPAFRLRRNGKLMKRKGREAKVSRVKKTYDFTRIRKILGGEGDELPEELNELPRRRVAELRRRLQRGQAIAWNELEDLLEVSHAKGYAKPGHPHGTHVAGVLAADWRSEEHGEGERDLVGICPDLWLYDFRVLDEHGTGDEFSILAALQFIRFINSRSRRPLIQGANLSLSVPHDVSNYACGRTPLCEEAERLHDSGVLVVAAAGNKGHVQYLESSGRPSEAYRSISITDPGNAGAVFTVGSTHRRHPHTFGVSYFSSRGPTGDGRVKPDIVAPGEKISGPVPDGGLDTMDGTSQAAPHVSGAAALIMSRHPEFIGCPDRIKQILCDTATDLGRERYFQGAGLVDVCRALQSI